MKKFLPIIAGVLLLIGIVFALRSNHQPAPAFTLPELNGKGSISERTFSGKVTLLNFWYPSCPGCVTEMPKLIALQQKFGQENYQTVAISLNYNSEAEVRAYAAQYRLPFLIAYDKDNQVKTSYNVELTPMTFLINPNGKIIRSYIGEPNWTELESEISRLLAP